MQALQPTLADLVRLAFGDVQNPSLPVSFPDFLTSPLYAWTDFEMCLDAVGVQETFDPLAVAQELRPIFPELMDVRIGRQEDILIVASVPFWTHQAIAWKGEDRTGRRLTRPERETLARRVESAFKRTGGGVGWLVDDEYEDGPALLDVSGHWPLPTL